MTTAKEYDRKAIRIGAFITAAEARIDASRRRIDDLNLEYEKLGFEAARDLTPAEFEEIFGFPPEDREPVSPAPADPIPTDEEIERIAVAVGKKPAERTVVSNVTRVPVDELVRRFAKMVRGAGAKAEDFGRIFAAHDAGVRIGLDDQEDDQELGFGDITRGMKRANLSILMDLHARKIKRQIMRADDDELDKIARVLEQTTTKADFK